MARIFKRGKVWYLDFSYRGRRVIRSTKQEDRKLADLALKKIEVAIAKDEWLGIEERPKILFRDYAERYLAHSRANKTPKSHRRDITSIRANLLPVFGGRYLDEIRPESIENYKAMRISEVKPATVNRELGCLRHMLNKAIQWGYLTDTPMKGIRLLREPPARVRYLEADEVTRLLEACSQHLKPIVLCALHTGMRKSEILNLKWRDVSFRERTVTIQRTKSNRKQTIPMNGLLCAALRRLPEKSEYVFCGDDGRPFGDVKRGFRAAMKRAGINDFRFHDLRHTFASHLAMSGCNLKTIQELLGHSDVKTTIRYSHLSKKHLEEAVNLVGARLSVDTNVKQWEEEVSERQVPL